MFPLPVRLSLEKNTWVFVIIAVVIASKRCNIYSRIRAADTVEHCSTGSEGFVSRLV